MQISRNIVNGPKSNNYVLVGIRAIVCVQKPPHHFLQTFRPLRIFKSVFRDSSLHPKQLSLSCLIRLVSASTDSNGYFTNFCTIIELWQKVKKAGFKIGFRNLIMSQQGKRKSKRLLDFYT